MLAHVRQNKFGVSGSAIGLLALAIALLHLSLGPIEKGPIHAELEKGRTFEEIVADAVVRVDRAWFDRAVTGEEKLMPAVLRGEISLDGGYALLVQLSRLLPGPPGQSGPTKARNGRRRSG